MTWIITGAAGYIGSHTVLDFIDNGYEVVAIDNLERGNCQRLPASVEFHNMDIRNIDDLKRVVNQRRIEGIVHFAAYKSVEESMKFPDKYWSNNALATQNLIDFAINSGVSKFIQSSSSSVYGNSKTIPIREDAELSPISIYGKSKLFAENYLNLAIENNRIMGTSLRYFNVAGAKSSLLRDSSIGNLIPNVISRIRMGMAPVIYGKNYPTKDGTCVRDYVHVSDISRAHLLAAGAVQRNPRSLAYNLGTQFGYTVMEVVTEILKQSKSNLPIEFKPHREGDPAIVISDNERAKAELGFEVKYSLSEIICSSLT